MGSYGTGDEGRHNTNTDEEEDLPNVTPVAPIVVQPPGVDPYYGVSITGLNSSSGGGSGYGTIPDSQNGLGGSKASSDADRKEYEDYLNTYGYGAFGGDPSNAMSYSEWRYWRDNTSNSNNNAGNTNTRSGGFQIARPNMTWVNSLPSVIPSGGQALADMYGPTPFTRGANTPGVTYTKPPLTYNNPYNTNPYLPLSNPFALIANNTGNTNG